jgi:hypothetical protein
MLEIKMFENFFIIMAITTETESAILRGVKISDNLKIISSITGIKIATRRKYNQRWFFNLKGMSNVSSTGSVKNALRTVVLIKFINPIKIIESKYILKDVFKIGVSFLSLAR